VSDAPEPAVAGDAAATGAQTAPEPAAPAGVDRNARHRRAAEAFYASDGDRDGFLRAVEAVELSPAGFEAADRDGDGRLTLVEYVDARFEEVEAASAPPAGAPEQVPPPTQGPEEPQAPTRGP
jgi:hypothetical protein